MRARKMKVQCDGCGNAEASVICCADEAALCVVCDRRIHRANKLASKHQRVGLIYPAPEETTTCCDICQDKAGFFFCLEDRALLCRSCDYSIHSSNALTAKHKRFLVAGIRVALEASPITTESAESTQTCQKSTDANLASEVSSPKVTLLPNVTGSGLTDTQESYRGPPSLSVTSQSASLNPQNCISYEQTEKCGTSNASPLKSEKLLQAWPVATPGQEVVVVLPSGLAPVPDNAFNYQLHFNSDWEMRPSEAGVHSYNMSVSSAVANRSRGDGFVGESSISEYLTETIPGWRVDELLSFTERSSTRNLTDCGSSKTGVGNFGENEWQTDCNTIEDMIFAQGPAEVPSIPSSPTSSGVLRSTRGWGVGKFVKPSDSDCLLMYDDAPMVPDIGTSPSMQFTIAPPAKRRRIGVDF